MIAIEGRRCLTLSGDVRLENSGSFIQMASDLAPQAGTRDGLSYGRAPLYRSLAAT